MVTQIRHDVARGHGAVARWAVELGVSWTTVAGAAYGWTWRSVTTPAPVAPPRPESLTPVYARLDEATVARMRRTYRAGQTTLGRLAREYGVSESEVRQAVLGITWRHVAEPPAQRAGVGGWAVVSTRDEAEIVRRRARRKPPQPFREIARELGHDVATVHRAWRRLRPAPSKQADAPRLREVGGAVATRAARYIAMLTHSNPVGITPEPFSVTR